MHGPWSKKKRKGTRGKTVERKCYVDDRRCIYLLYAYTQTSRHIENFSIVRGDANNNGRASRLLFLLYTIDWGCRLCVCVKNLVCIAVPYILKGGERDYLFGRPILSLLFFSLSSSLSFPNTDGAARGEIRRPPSPSPASSIRFKKEREREREKNFDFQIGTDYCYIKKWREQSK